MEWQAGTPEQAENCNTNDLGWHMLPASPRQAAFGCRSRGSRCFKTGHRSTPAAVFFPTALASLPGCQLLVAQDILRHTREGGQRAPSKFQASRRHGNKAAAAAFPCRAQRHGNAASHRGGPISQRAAPPPPQRRAAAGAPPPCTPPRLHGPRWRSNHGWSSTHTGGAGMARTCVRLCLLLQASRRTPLRHDNSQRARMPPGPESCASIDQHADNRTQTQAHVHTRRLLGRRVLLIKVVLLVRLQPAAVDVCAHAVRAGGGERRGDRRKLGRQGRGGQRQGGQRGAAQAGQGRARAGGHNGAAQAGLSHVALLPGCHASRCYAGPPVLHTE